MIKEFDIQLSESIQAIEPLGFMEFLKVEANAKLVLTDSGGVQEECCILGVPCLTIRENTERPETIEVGANILGGYSSIGIAKSADSMLNIKKNWINPFGDGHAGEKILNICK